MKDLTIITVICTAAILSACDRIAPKTTLLTFEPSSLSNCDQFAEVIVKWDVRISHPDVHNVQIFVTDGASEILFTEGSAWGNAKSGSWVRPGVPRFVIKDKTNSKVLFEAAIDGPRCQ